MRRLRPLARVRGCAGCRVRARCWRWRAWPSEALALHRWRVARGRLPRLASCRSRTWDRPRARPGRCTLRLPGARVRGASCRGGGWTLGDNVRIAAIGSCAARTARRQAGGLRSFVHQSNVWASVEDPLQREKVSKPALGVQIPFKCLAGRRARPIFPSRGA